MRKLIEFDEKFWSSYLSEFMIGSVFERYVRFAVGEMFLAGEM